MKTWMVIIVAAVVSTGLYAHVGDHSHSIFMPHPVSSNLLYTGGHRLMAPLDDPQDSSLIVEHSVLYQQATDTDKNIPFFFGKGKQSLRVDEGEAGDLNPQWFNIASTDDSTYKSRLFIKPERELHGVVLRVQHGLGAVCNGMWAALSVPIMTVTHRLNPSESKDSTTVTSDETLFGSMPTALDWDNWRANKWSSVPQSYTGADDVTMQCGITLKGPRESTQRFYLEIALPVGSRPTGQYLFEPVVNGGGHFGLGLGISTVAPVYTFCDEFHFMYVTQAQYRYHFAGKQQRTPDLKGQPFSRYLIYMDTDLTPNVTNVSLKAANGVNFFTRDVVVTPGATGQSMNALQFRYKGHTINTGYLYWWHAAEQVHFEHAPLRTFAVPSPKGLIGDAQAWLPSPRIENVFSAADASATTSAAVLHDIEFDMDSIAMPHTASHTLFLDYNGRFTFDWVTLSPRAGFAYEMADNCAALSSWHLWVSMGVTL